MVAVFLRRNGIIVHMAYLISMEPSTIFAAGVAVVVIVLLAFQIYNSRRVNRLAYPVYEYALKRAENEAERILVAARAEARQLVEKAEEESLSLVAAHKGLDEAAERNYQKALQAMLERLEVRLKEDVVAAGGVSTQISANFAAELKAVAEESRTHLGELFATLANENKARVDERVEQVFAAAKAEAEAYARARKDAVDAHIVALIGETMKIVLQKDMSPQQHESLVQAALQEAKANHVF